MRLLPNVYQLCGNMYSSHQNVFAIDTGTYLILVDTGLGEKDLTIIRRNLKRYHLEDKKISHVLLTHEHVEHISNAAYFKENGAMIIAHTDAARNIEKGSLWIGDYRYPGFSFTPFSVEKTVDDNDVVNLNGLDVEVIHTPGHSRGSVLYKTRVNDLNVVFSGDVILLVKECHKVRFGWTGSLDYDQEAFIKSMQKISKVEADILLTGHGEVCLHEAYREFFGAWLRTRLDLVRDHHYNPLKVQEDKLCR